MNTQGSELDATALAELVARCELDAVELLEACCARIEALEPSIHALAGMDVERARERARLPITGPFAGVPTLVKDLLPVPGTRCEMGSRLFRGNVATEGAPFTTRLEASGLVTLGRTTTSEFGLLGSTETLLAGATRNPWDLSRSATGSSGGAAAAVAAGMVPLAHASDGGGSIRIPASACGVFGLKPTRGRCAPAGPSDLNGLIVEHAVSRTVRDSARFLAAVEERSGPHAPVGVVRGPSARRLRIGFYDRTLMGDAPDAEVGEVLARTVALLDSLGHEVIEAAPPPVDGTAISNAFFTLAGAGMSQMAAMMAGFIGHEPGEQELEPFTLDLIAWFRALPASAVLEAMSALETAGDAMRRHLGSFDVLLCPTMPMVAPPLGYLAPTLDRETVLRRTERLAGYTPIHNIAGVPAMSVPLFRTRSGMPAGSHFAAGVGEDATLLALAFELEEAAPWIGSYPVLGVG